MRYSRIIRAISLTLGLAATLMLGACARNAADADLAGGAGVGAGAGRAGAPGSLQDFTANVGDRVFFDSDSSELNAAGQATLDKQSNWLTRYVTYSFIIEGHADERGTREYNFGLGSRRAETVKTYLIAKGVGAGRMKTISYGKERPVAVCDDISCWSQNRRAVTVLAGAAGS